MNSTTQITTTATPIVLKVEGLTIERDQMILDKVDWEVTAGQHWVILGANGSGKTSVLNALTGYMTPTAGLVQVGEAKYGRADWSQVRKNIGLVSSSLAQQIEPLQTARDVILSGPQAHINYWENETEDEGDWADRVLRRIKAKHLANRNWCQLSQGERQRVLIGRALAAVPKLLFLDEPCAGLDPVAREDFLTFLGDFAHRHKGPSLVLITHHVEEILPIFTHIIMMKNGKVLVSGKKEDVLNSRNLSETFGVPLVLRKVIRGGKPRFQLDVGDERRISFVRARVPVRSTAPAKG